MNQQLSTSLLTDFWYRVYFRTSDTKDLKLAVIKRAYRDFNRTLPGVGIIENKDEILVFSLQNIIDEALTTKFQNHEKFDIWHQDKCDSIVNIFNNELRYPEFYLGHAQIWVNMSLKYCLAIGDDVFKGITQNINYLHIPIDNVIQDRLLIEYKVTKIIGAWSKINYYEVYLNYQKEVREKIAGKIPIIVEFELFNK